MDTITIEIAEPLLPAVHEELEDALREFFERWGFSVVITNTATGNTTTNKPE